MRHTRACRAQWQAPDPCQGSGACQRASGDSATGAGLTSLDGPGLEALPDLPGSHVGRPHEGMAVVGVPAQPHQGVADLLGSSRSAMPPWPAPRSTVMPPQFGNQPYRRHRCAKVTLMACNSHAAGACALHASRGWSTAQASTCRPDCAGRAAPVAESRARVLCRASGTLGPPAPRQAALRMRRRRLTGHAVTKRMATGQPARTRTKPRRFYPARHGSHAGRGTCPLLPPLRSVVRSPAGQ